MCREGDSRKCSSAGKENLESVVGMGLKTLKVGERVQILKLIF